VLYTICEAQSALVTVAIRTSGPVYFVSDPPASAASPTGTAERRETVRRGLRILAWIIARAHLWRETRLDMPVPDLSAAETGHHQTEVGWLTHGLHGDNIESTGPDGGLINLAGNGE
jgi:hypothetical protein